MSDRSAAQAAPDSLQSHRLQPLLAPRSVAVLGASAREGSFGHSALLELVENGFPGTVYAVNPRYETVAGYRCAASLADLDGVPDLALFSIANARLEAQFELAARLGVPAAVVFGTGYLPGEARRDALVGRLRDIAREAGMQVCGGNCMGFMNACSRVSAGVMRLGLPAEPGPVAVISHSGTAWGVLTNLEHRVHYNLAVSAGQEIATTAADYLDYALEMPGTRCVAMFLETVRDPEGFSLAVERAHRRGIPVVAVKVGRSEMAARFAVSHSGAMVGDDAAYQAFFDRLGVMRVDGIDSLVNAIQLFAYGRPLPDGGIAVALDSGGRRELLVDTAEELGVPVAAIGERTAAVITDNLGPEPEPVNPLDFWVGGGPDWDARLVNCIEALAEDDATALFMILSLLNWNDVEGYSGALLALARRTRKPLCMLTDFVRTRDVEHSIALNRAGVPVLEGERAGLVAIRAAMRYRDFLARPRFEPARLPPGVPVARWRERLRGCAALDAAAAAKLLDDFGLTVLPCEVVEAENDLERALESVGYPAVLKTDMPGIAHKSDVGGVRLGLTTLDEALAAYREMARVLGPRVLVTRQASAGGVEMALGLVRDPLVGTLVMIGAGGTLIEWLDDKVCVPAPSSREEIVRAIGRLACRPLLDGPRDRPAVDVGALAGAALSLSLLGAALGDLLAEVDVNPLLVTAHGCVVLDALIVPAR